MEKRMIAVFAAAVIILLAVLACTNIFSTPSTSESAESLPVQSSDASHANSIAESNSTAESSPAESVPPEESSQPPLELPYPDIFTQNYKSLRADTLDAYFDNSVFIGNSIMTHFYNFLSAKRSAIPEFLGASKVIQCASYSPSSDFEPISDDSYHPTYQGEKMHAWDIVAAMGAKTAYVNVMALNELGRHYESSCVEDTYDNFIKYLGKIKEASPGINLVVLSNTHMAEGFNYTRLNNTNINRLNTMVSDYCAANGIDYIDISSFLSDGNNLASVYCKDMQSGGSGCHLTNDAYALWTATLRNYAFMKINSAK